jgi:hypothetical protein
MGRRAVIMMGCLVAGLAACTAKPAAQPEVPPASAPETTVPTTSAVPPANPVPGVEAKCPYLESAYVADANGQRVGKVRVSADKPHPACFFYRSDGKIQLTVQVYVGDAGSAKALVDKVAPVSTADPATLADGWAGGSQSTSTGAVFAVAKEKSAVVITTNQKQTIKAKRVAEQTIAALAL